MKLDVAKDIKNETSKYAIAKTDLRIIQSVTAFLILCPMMMCLLALPLTQTQAKASRASAQAKPTPPDDPLDQEALDALLEKLTNALAESVSDEETQDAIMEKWSARLDGLVGKTARQVIDLLLADVKSVVEDAGAVNQLKESFMAAAGIDSEAEDESELNETLEPDQTSELGSQTANMQQRSAVEKSPLWDTKRFDSMKVTDDPDQDWKFKVKAGEIIFKYDRSGGYATFKPNRRVGNAPIAWIQVVRTGGKDRWYGTAKDVNAFSANNSNFVLRTDPVYGFRVDKTKDENVPFYEQTTIKIGETLNTYKLAFDIQNGFSSSGGVISFSDSPQPGLAHKRLNQTTTEYRMYFLLSPINTQTGEIYGTVEWAVASTLPLYLTKTYVPTLIKQYIPEMKGRDLAFERWNTVVSKQYVPMRSVPPSKNAPRMVYPIPGKGRFWMK